MSTYSALIRRSKLAAYTPSIDQVYASHSSHLSRSLFGLKRPLPSATTKISPFVRISSLDNSQRRTDFRKATKETLFVKKVMEANIGIKRVEGDAAIVDTEVQSRYLPAGQPGAILDPDDLMERELRAKSAPDLLSMSQKKLEDLIGKLLAGDETAQNTAQKTVEDIKTEALAAGSYRFLKMADDELVKFFDGLVAGKPDHLAKLQELRAEAFMDERRIPNFFAMADEEFESFLESLGARREEFIEFVRADLAKGRAVEIASGTDPEFSLYKQAQSSPTHLGRLLSRFLSSTPTRPSRRPLPCPHPTLGLQYSSPPLLESSFLPPIPGRVLGVPPPQSQHTGTGNYASVLSSIVRVPPGGSGGGSTTTWFPDSAGIRDNAPGRANFIVTPQMQYVKSFADTINRTSIRGGKTHRRNRTHEPQALASKVITFNATVDNSLKMKPVPGTQAYSGNVSEYRTSPIGNRGLDEFFQNSLVERTGSNYRTSSRAAFGEKQRRLKAGLKNSYGSSPKRADLLGSLDDLLDGFP